MFKDIMRLKAGGQNLTHRLWTRL